MKKTKLIISFLVVVLAAASVIYLFTKDIEKTYFDSESNYSITFVCDSACIREELQPPASSTYGKNKIEIPTKVEGVMIALGVISPQINKQLRDAVYAHVASGGEVSDLNFFPYDFVDMKRVLQLPVGSSNPVNDNDNGNENRIATVEEIGGKKALKIKWSDRNMGAFTDHFVYLHDETWIDIREFVGYQTISAEHKTEKADPTIEYVSRYIKSIELK